LGVPGWQSFGDSERHLAAKVTLDLTGKQLDAGYANYLVLLSAEQAYLQALIALVQAQSNRYADPAALFQALGGDGGIEPMSPRTSKRWQ
jgi:outer membrane protein TolC